MKSLLTSRAARKTCFFLLLAGSHLLTASVGSAQTAIDPLSAVQTPLAATGGATTAGVVADASILGGERDVRLRHRSGPGSSALTVADGILSLTSGAIANVELALTWDGADGDAFTVATAGLGANLTAGGGGGFRLALNSASAGISATIRVWSAAGVSSKSLIVPALTAPQTILLPFASFTPVEGAGADFTQVGAIEIVFLGTGATLSLDSIEIAPAGAQLKGNLLDNAVSVGPGGTLNYSAPLINQGPGSAAGVRLQVPLPTSATLLPGSIEVSPVAADDSTWVIHDSALTVVTPGVLSNDQDMETPPDPIAVNPAGPRVTFRGGSAMVNTNGSFSYQPPSGFVGVDRFDYLVDDGNGIPGPGTVFVDVQCSPIVVTPASLSAGAQGLGYAAVTFSATGAPTQISWSALGLPAGLWINASSGVLSGTPTVAGTFAVQIQATDTASCQGTRNLSLLIEPPVADPVLNPASGRWYTQRNISVTTTTPGATIYYTTDGSEPTESSTPIPVGGQLLVNRAMAIRVKAFKPATQASQSVHGSYLITGQLDGGQYHSMALKANGELWEWGANSQGQIGIGATSTVYTSPVLVLSGVIQAAAGQLHSAAIKADGTVWTWGDNASGQLGRAVTGGTPSTLPGQVNLGGVPAIAIAAGPFHMLALLSTGEVRSWGAGFAGQLGQGTSTPSSTPVVVLAATGGSLTNVVSVAVGDTHSLALRADGTLAVWGENISGALGDGTTTNRTKATVLTSLSGVKAMSAKASSSYAIVGASRELKAWGYNSNGQLGDETTTTRLSPVLITSGVREVAAGESHMSFVASNARLWGAGSNGFRQLGDATTTTRKLPVRSRVSRMVVTIGQGRSHSLVAAPDGAVWASGNGSNGQLGLGNNLTPFLPSVIPAFSLFSGPDLEADLDADGLTLLEEFFAGTDPLVADTNGNGMLDGPEYALGLDGMTADSDGDGLSNTAETLAGTNPFLADTDGDAYADGVDQLPLDPTQHSISAIPGDTTPPVIALFKPSGASVIP